jgi:hypothetical protein
MSTAAFHIERSHTDEVGVLLSGCLDESVLLSCERELRMQLGLAKSASLRVLIDLRGVTGYTLDARTVLVRMQRFIAVKASRVIFVVDRPEPRALALWAVHMAGPWDARMAADPSDARAFLRGRSDPPTGVRPLASTRPPSAVEPHLDPHNRTPHKKAI